MMRVQDAEILAFIEAFKERHGYAPSVREIQANSGCKAVSTIQWHLDRLTRQGKLTRRRKTPRTLVVRRAE